MADNEGVNIKIYILMGILMIIIAAGTSFMFMNYYSSAENSDADSDKEKIGQTHSLGEFVVNLSLNNSYKYLKADIVVSTSNDDVIKEIEKRDPQVRDNIISILRQQDLEKIKEPEATNIKSQIKNKLNDILQQGEIKEVWFTALVVQ